MKKRDYIIAFSIVLILFYFSQYLYDAFGIREKGTISEQLIRSLNGNEEKSPEQDPLLLIVNPAYDGTNSEFIYSSRLEDSEKVSKILQTITYAVFNNSGSAIKSIQTTILDAENKIIFSANKRTQSLMSDILVSSERITISYLYEEDNICRTENIRKFSDESLLSSEETTTNIPR